MSEEAKLLLKYGLQNTGAGEKLTIGKLPFFNVVKDLMSYGAVDEVHPVDMVNTDSLKNEIANFKNQMDELYKYLTALKKFRYLNKLLKGKLVVSGAEGCFYVGQRSFNALAEVEKAWNNKELT